MLLSMNLSLSYDAGDVVVDGSAPLLLVLRNRLVNRNENTLSILNKFVLTK